MDEVTAVVEKKPEQQEENPTVIFFALPRKMQLANYVPEKRSGAVVVQVEAPLEIDDHIKVTNDPDEIAFIKKSNSFAVGTIMECASLEDALVRRSVHRKEIGGVHVINCESVTKR